ncbi:hypothetical protein [Haloarcula laminariae]|uniref:hypothetical protein n=1 Tax=Haloarcula laminariae TaxID=2961577 RepID=UPI0024072F0E|nr:hypothetical protein [Halomicroarcula sp. FL173]
MALEDFIGGTNSDVNMVDWTDYDKELAGKIDEKTKNDTWRGNYKQPYYVTTVVKQTLEALPAERPQRRKAVPSVRSDIQGQIADDVGVEKQTVQRACHTDLFEGYEQPPKKYIWEENRPQWVELFDQLIRELDRTWYQSEGN